MAIVRDDRRYSLPSPSSYWRKSIGDLAPDWAPLIKAARKGDLSQIDGPVKDAATLLSLLWNFDPTPDPEAVLNIGWKKSARVAIDGWVGTSGRLIAACLQTDVTFHTDGPVTGFRRREDGTVDGIKRKGRVLPVDAVIQACSRSDSVLYGRYLGLDGNFLRPHIVLWDADREVLLIDLGSLIPERAPKEYPPPLLCSIVSHSEILQPPRREWKHYLTHSVQGGDVRLLPIIHWTISVSPSFLKQNL